MKEKFTIPISYLRQHIFCPRIPYFQLVYANQVAEPGWVRQGTRFHEKQAAVFRRRTLKRFGLEEGTMRHAVSAREPRLGIHGKLDALIELPEEIIPLEFKLSGSKPAPNQINQLVAYGVALGRQYRKPCRRGFLVFGKKGRSFEVVFDRKMFQKMLLTIHAIRRNVYAGQLPHSNAGPAKCGQCEYINYCNDRNF